MGDVVFRANTTQGIALEYCCDGLVTVDFSRYPPLVKEEAEHEKAQQSGTLRGTFIDSSSFILRRTEILNAHSLCLKSAAASVQKIMLPTVVVSPHDVVHLAGAADQPQGVGFKNLWDSYRYTARHFGEYIPGVTLGFDPRIAGRVFIVQEATLADAVSRLGKCVEADDGRALKLCALLNFAVGSLEDHDYSRCLVTCWGVIEALLSKRWDNYLLGIADRDEGGGKKFINKERRGKLTSNDYTASIIIENLSLLDKLTFQEYSVIEIVRKARNKWMHELTDVPMDKALMALRASSMLYHSEFKVELPEGVALRL
jgi:hypothetical protein